MTLYRAFTVQDQFGLNSLKACSRPIPTPKANQVLIQMSAIALNYRDYLMVSGQYNPRQSLPFIPCSDGVGVIVETGPSCSLKVGMRVMPTFAQGWIADDPTKDVFKTTLGGPLDGTLAEYICVDEKGVVEVPSYLTDLEASTLGCAGLTAWSALAELGQIKAGDQVVCIGTGGVSLFAAQIANMLGADVWITSRTQEKLNRLTPKILGFTLESDRKIVASESGWGRTIRQESWNKEGVDHIIEVGGAHTLSESLTAVRNGGTISLIGILSGHQTPLNLLPILMRQIRIQGVFVGHKKGFERFNKALSMHQIHPIIDRVFDFSEAPQAFKALAQGQHIGKLVIGIDH